MFSFSFLFSALYNKRLFLCRHLSNKKISIPIKFWKQEIRNIAMVFSILDTRSVVDHYEIGNVCPNLTSTQPLSLMNKNKTEILSSLWLYALSENCSWIFEFSILYREYSLTASFVSLVNNDFVFCNFARVFSAGVIPWLSLRCSGKAWQISRVMLKKACFELTRLTG